MALLQLSVAVRRSVSRLPVVGSLGVLAEWNGAAAKRAFLREVRDGACRFYGTMCSPDCNAAHADRLRLDTAVRGAGLFGGCCR